MKKLKKHYVPKIWYTGCYCGEAACGQFVYMIKRLKEVTHYRNHVTCENCRRTKVFRGVR